MRLWVYVLDIKDELLRVIIILLGYMMELYGLSDFTESCVKKPRNS